MTKNRNFLDEIGGLDFVAELGELARRGEGALPDAVFDRHASLEDLTTAPAPGDVDETTDRAAAPEPAKRYASLEALRADGYEAVGHGMYRKAHHLWSVSATADGQLGVWRHAPEPSADLLLRDRSLVGRRARARIRGRLASVTVIDVTDQGVHVEHEAAPAMADVTMGAAPMQGVMETTVIPAEDLIDFEEPDDLVDLPEVELVDEDDEVIELD